MSRLATADSFRTGASPVPPPPDCVPATTRLARLADLTPHDHARWALLSARADAPNIFAHDWFMQAALAHAPDRDAVHLAIVTHLSGAWLGVIPLIGRTRFGHWPVAHWQGWAGITQFLGTPLVLPAHAALFWDTLLGFLDTQSGRAMMLHLDALDADDRVTGALLAHCDREMRAIRTVGRFDRPALRAGEDQGAPHDGKARARLRSLSRKLARDHGALTFSILDAAQDPAPWIDAFLALEAAGWKGRTGSALGSDDATAALFRTLITRGHERGSVRLATLHAGDRAVARSCWFEAACWGHGFKMAFDEELRAYAPGQLLMQAVRDHVGARGDLSFDTCVSRGAHHCDRLWRGTRPLVDIVVAIGPPGRRLRFTALMTARDAYARIKARLTKADSQAYA